MVELPPNKILNVDTLYYISLSKKILINIISTHLI